MSSDDIDKNLIRVARLTVGWINWRQLHVLTHTSAVLQANLTQKCSHNTNLRHIWLVGWDLTVLLTQIRSYRAFKVINYFEKNIF